MTKKTTNEKKARKKRQRNISNRWDRQKTQSKMVDLRSIISAIILNVNVLNAPSRSQILRPQI